LAAVALDRVPQHQQLEIFHMQAAAATNQRTEQSPKSEIDEGEDDIADPRSPRPLERGDTKHWRPSPFKAVGVRRLTVEGGPRRRSDHLDAFGAEDLVEPAAELAVSITDQELWVKQPRSLQ